MFAGAHEKERTNATRISTTHFNVAASKALGGGEEEEQSNGIAAAAPRAGFPPPVSRAGRGDEGHGAKPIKATDKVAECNNSHSLLGKREDSARENGRCWWIWQVEGGN